MTFFLLLLNRVKFFEKINIRIFCGVYSLDSKTKNFKRHKIVEQTLYFTGFEGTMITSTYAINNR